MLRRSEENRSWWWIRGSAAWLAFGKAKELFETWRKCARLGLFRTTCTVLVVVTRFLSLLDATTRLCFRAFFFVCYIRLRSWVGIKFSELERPVFARSEEEVWKAVGRVPDAEVVLVRRQILPAHSGSRCANGFRPPETAPLVPTRVFTDRLEEGLKGGSHRICAAWLDKGCNYTVTLAEGTWDRLRVRPHNEIVAEMADGHQVAQPIGRCEVLADGAHTRRLVDAAKSAYDLLGMSFIQHYNLSMPAGQLGTLESPVRE